MLPEQIMPKKEDDIIDEIKLIVEANLNVWKITKFSDIDWDKYYDDNDNDEMYRKGEFD